MTEALHLSLSANAAQVLAVSTRLVTQARDTGGRKWLRPLVFAVGLICALMVGSLLDVPANKAFFIALTTFYTTLLALWLGSRATQRRYFRLLEDSACRMRPTPVSLSAEGLRMEPRAFPWSDIIAVTRWNDMTLLQFSPVDAIIIPDADLPAGETPETLATRITTWKTK
ncbi:MAG: YcxB family protein [Paracoccaceae bacterium]